MFHSRFNRVVAVIVWLVCLVAMTAVLIAGVSKHWEYLPALVLVAFFAWVGLWRPSVEVSDEAVQLVNVLSTVTIPWPAIIQVDTKFALTIVTPQGKFAATAAPAPSRLTTVLSRRDVGRAKAQLGTDGRIKPGDLPNTDSGAAAILIRERWEQLKREDRIEIGIADETKASIRWHIVTMVVGGLLLAATVASLAYG